MPRKPAMPAAPERGVTDRPAACDGAPLPDEGRLRMVRAVYPLNPGIPHELDFPVKRGA